MAPVRALLDQAGGTVSDDRDSWATPAWLTALLPVADLDPCSNDRSTVRAFTSYQLARGEDGLSLPWRGVLYVNPPYSAILPWADKLANSPYVTACAFLINADPSTKWWRRLSSRLDVALFFHQRIKFSPPPGVQTSSNSKPQALMMDRAFLALCPRELLGLGTLWATVQGYGSAVA